MDRMKEAADQAALDASNRRRHVRQLLRSYISARHAYFHEKDELVRSFARILLVETILELQLSGFQRWKALRNSVKKPMPESSAQSCETTEDGMRGGF